MMNEERTVTVREPGLRVKRCTVVKEDGETVKVRDLDGPDNLPFWVHRQFVSDPEEMVEGHPSGKRHGCLTPWCGVDNKLCVDCAGVTRP
jgi:hypothetical protein